MNVYFPTTNFLAKVEQTNDCLLEDKYDSDQLFFSVLNNPGYITSSLLNNFNNKYNRFFDNYRFLRDSLKNKRCCFYEYSTFHYKENETHKDIASGCSSWTLAYFTAGLLSIFQTLGNPIFAFHDVIISGDIGNFTSWNHISGIESIYEKIAVSVSEFLFHEQLKHKKEVVFLYKSDQDVELDLLMEELPIQPIRLETHNNQKTVLVFKNPELKFILIPIKNLEDVLGLLLENDWQTPSGIGIKKEYSILKQENKTIKKLYGVIFLLSLLFVLALFDVEHTIISTDPTINEERIKFTLDPFVQIEKWASQIGDDSISPHGYLVFSLFIIDNNFKYLKESRDIKQIEIVYPNGDQSLFINPHQRFEVSQKKYGQGNLVYGLEKKWLLFSGMDLSYHTKKIPEAGAFTFVVLSRSNHASSATATFIPGKGDPISGFPSDIRYDSEKRKVSWKHSGGQTGYRVMLFKGKKGNAIDWSELVYNSVGILIKENHHIIPRIIELEQGQVYTILVAAVDSPDGYMRNTNYMHIQDIKEEVAEFIAP